MPGKRLLAAVSALAVTGLFLYLVWPATGDYLNPDDSMNLYVAWTKSPAALVRGSFCFWQGQMRPVGAIYYRLVYAVSGFRPEPFRATCFALLVLNLILAMRFFHLITGSARDTFLASIIGCFHGALWNIYASTGTVYDILCGTFCLTALISYIGGRQRGTLGLGRAALVLLALILAVESKEIAYALPFAFLAYEAVFHRPWRWRNGLVPAISLGIVIATWLGRRAVHSDIDQMDVYKPAVTPENFLHGLAQYESLLSFKTLQISGWQALGIALGLLALAALLSSRVMIFGWLYYFALSLPLLVVPARQSAYVLYVPFAGAALYLAGLVGCAASKFSPGLPQYAFLVAFLSAWASLEKRQQELVVAMDFFPGGEETVRVLSEDVSRACPRLPIGSRILLINDPFGVDERWQPMFILGLTYRDKSLKVDKMHRDPGAGDAAVSRAAYDHVFIYEASHYREIKSR